MLYGAHLSNGEFKIIKYFSSRCFPTRGLSGLNWRVKLFQIKRDKNKGLECCHQYLPSLDILTLIIISYFQHEEGLSCVSNESNPMQQKTRNKDGKHNIKKTQTHFTLKKEFQNHQNSVKCSLVPSALCYQYRVPYNLTKLISSTTIIHFHHSTRLVFLQSATFTFVALQTCIFTVLLWWTWFHAFSNSFGSK